MSQSKISRIEHGLAVPTRDEIHRLVDALGGTKELAADWSERAEKLRDQLVDARSAGRQPHHIVGPLQTEIGQLEDAADAIRIFQAGIIPGLLQAEDYARAILTACVEVLPITDSVDWRQEIFFAVTRRMQRQGVLQDTAKKIEIVITESALQFRLCPAEVMLVQLRKIRELAKLENLRFGIIPMGVQLRYPPTVGFEIIDGKTVWLDMPMTVVYAQSEDDIHAFMTIFDAYLEQAETDIDGILDRYVAQYLGYLREIDG
jgi:hypothetical protein